MNKETVYALVAAAAAAGFLIGRSFPSAASAGPWQWNKEGATMLWNSETGEVRTYEVHFMKRIPAK